MKKFVSLLLAALMLLGCTAFATEMNSNLNDKNAIQVEGDKELGWTKNVTHMEAVGENAHFDQSEVENKKDTTEEYASQKTDVWLQVDSTGQIDVTVPLVVVFKTNIDGGKATTAQNYQIMNNSSAGVKVTRVEIEDLQAEVSTNGDDQKMELVKTVNRNVYDQYALSFVAENDYVGSNNVWSGKSDVSAWNKSGNVYSQTADVNEKQGLWLIDKEKDGSEVKAGVTNVELTMETSRLSFVTKDDNAKYEQGVKLFTITYTVQIDDSEAKGVAIEGKDAQVHKDLNMTYAYEIGDEATQETEYTAPGSVSTPATPEQDDATITG